MPDITQPRASSSTGTATPSSTNSITAVAGNLLVCIVVAIGTNPTIATPTGLGTWIQAQKTQGATLSAAMYYLANNPGGAVNPSAVLGGTVTGWYSVILEFTATGANCGLQGSAQLASAIAQLTNVFPGGGNTLSNELFVYTVARASAGITPQNTFLGPLSVWSASVQNISNVQGLSVDTYWASGLGQGVGQYPQASGLLGGAVASVAIGAWFNTSASQSSNNDNVGGNNGILVGGNFQGMIGG